MKSFTISVIVVFLFVIAYFYFFSNNKNQINIISNQNDDKHDLIVVVSPIRDSLISSPLTISGRARGSWFFEGSFPIILLDAYRNTIAEGHASAQGEWMTDDFVKFVGNLQFNNYIKGQKGTLLIKKDNPSGLVENDDSLEIPIIFK